MNIRQSPCFCLFQLQWCYVPISIGKPCTGVQDVILEVSLFQVFNCTLYPLPSCTVTVCRTNLATREIVDFVVILTAYIHVRIVSHCHLAPPRPFFEYEVLFVFLPISHTGCHTVTLPHCNTVRPQQIQIWTASDNDPCMARSLVHWCRTGRHRAQARRQIEVSSTHYCMFRVLYACRRWVQTSSCQKSG